ncbi:MAG: glycosyltransferase family 4 protein [Cyclobacteriaceae bacterium]
MEIYNFYLVNNLLESSLNERMVVLSSCMNISNKKDKVVPLKDKHFIMRRYGLGPFSTVFHYLFSKKILWRKVDVIYLPYTSNFSYNAYAVFMLHFIFGINYVIHIHGGAMKAWKPVWVAKLFFKHAKRIAGVSLPIVKEYTRRYGRKVHYLAPILPFEKSRKSKQELRISMGLERYGKIILFVGSIKPLKAPETLLKAFVALEDEFRREFPTALLLVGDGPLLKSLKLNYGANPHVVFVGNVANEEIKDFYQLSDIFVIPSWFEGTPIALLEAMFNKLTCVGSNVVGVNQILRDGDNGYLFEKDNEGELSMILKNVIADDTDAKAKAEKAFLDFTLNYDYKKHLSEVINFIEN